LHIAVITPAYNVGAWIGQAITSVRAQTHQDWSLLVVDDGSTDDTAAIALAFDDRRIRVIRQANAGVSAARNRGIAEAHGDAVLFLDADDWLAPDAMQRLAAALAGGAVAAYGAYCFVTEDGRQVVARKTGPFVAGDILARLLEQNLFANGGHLLIRRDAIAAAGNFLSTIRYGEDWEYWIRIALIGQFAVVQGAEPLLYVRQRASGAYLRMASDPRSFTPCMDAIFGNPALHARMGDQAIVALRRRTEAENAWIVGRELLRHGHGGGRAMLRRSFAAKPSAKRALLLAAAHGLPLLPPRLRGPFRAYAPAGRTPPL
jgi:glycosyltransferase involved in cell wall biosynthesis